MLTKAVKRASCELSTHPSLFDNTSKGLGTQADPIMVFPFEILVYIFNTRAAQRMSITFYPHQNLNSPFNRSTKAVVQKNLDLLD